MSESVPTYIKDVQEWLNSGDNEKVITDLRRGGSASLPLLGPPLISNAAFSHCRARL